MPDPVSQPAQARVPSVSTVVFDLGGVLIEWDPRNLYRQLFTDEAEMEHFLTQVATPEWNHAMDAGRPFEDAAAELIELHPDHADHIRVWGTRNEEMVSGEIDGTVEVLAELRASGVHLLALTNWSGETFPAALERFPFLHWFDGIVVSGDEGLAKPDSALFQILLDRHAVEPEAAVFIDDKQGNVDAAASLGLHGITFTSPDALRAELVRLGLLDPRP